MTLRARIRWSLAGLALLSAMTVALGHWSRTVRGTASETLLEALRAERAITAATACLAKLQREVNLLASAAGGDTADALAPDLVGSVLDEVSACEGAWRVASEAAGAKVPPERVPTSVPGLLADWRFALTMLGPHQVEATTRLATQADPAAERLLAEELPALQRAYVALTRERVEAAHASAARAENVLWGTLATSVLLLAAGALLLLRRLAASLAAIVQGTEAFGRGDFAHRVEIRGRDELAATAQAVNEMAGRLAAANTLLQQRAVELESSIEELRGAQKALVQQEKMAALGGLVAGVAHEVNTPIGVALTAGTMVQEQVASLGRQVEAGTATKGAVRRALTDGQEGLALMVTNLRRAADLIQSFKQVAVDRDMPAARKTWLHEWTHAVVQSLSPLAKQHRVRVRLTQPETCQLELAAGELQQVLTNLVVNAFVHAFGDVAERAGEAVVEVAVGLHEDALLLTVADNGRGMSGEVAARCFEPFFTTRRGQGGTGLGMHIAYTLVTERFGGTIAVDTAPGSGCRWSVRLPFETQALRRLTPPTVTEAA